MLDFSRPALLLACCMGMLVAPLAAIAKPPAPGNYYVVGHSGSSPIMMHVVDPDAPSPPLLSVELPAEIYSPIGAILPSGPNANAVVGYPLVVYVKQGRLYKVSLAKPGTPQPLQVSSLTSICGRGALFNVFGDASDNVLELLEAGPDANCATTADNRRALVHTIDSAGTPPVFLPAGVSLLAPLRDKRGNLIWALARETTAPTAKLVLISPAGVPSGDVAGGTNVSSTFFINADNTSPQAGYMVVDGTLRHITWTAGGAALSGSLYTVVNGGVWMLSDVNGSYFADGLNIHRVVGATTPTPLAQLNSGNGNIATYSQTPTSLVFQQNDTAGQRASLTAVSKGSGAKVAIVPPKRMTQIGFPGVQGEKVAYFLRRLSDVPGSYKEELRSVMTDGTADTLVEAKLLSVGILFNRVLSPEIGLSTDVMLYCKPAANELDCRHGQLRQWAIDKGKTTTLGSLDGDVSLVRFLVASVGGWNPLPFAMRIYATRGEASTFESWTDLFTAKPGQAGSLGRVTTQIP